MIPNYRGHPPGEFASLWGWSLCWERTELPKERIRFTVTAIKPGIARSIFRDVVYTYEPSESAAMKSMAVLESQVRYLVEEIESLERSWSMKSST